MNTIDKIRAEIERRKKENMYVDLPMSIGRYYEDRDLLSFLDTLEEPVSDCHGLEEAADKFARLYDNGTCDGIAQDCFKAGAEWQKAKMMEGAVEGKVIVPIYDEGDIWSTEIEIPGRYEPSGSKLKIIVVKEDEK